MNKTELVDAVAIECDISRSAALKAVDSVFTNIERSLKKGEDVRLLGFGTFSVVERAARKGRNLKTNKAIDIPARKTPKFSAGKNLKDVVK